MVAARTEMRLSWGAQVSGYSCRGVVAIDANYYSNSLEVDEVAAAISVPVQPT